MESNAWTADVVARVCSQRLRFTMPSISATMSVAAYMNDLCMWPPCLIQPMPVIRIRKAAHIKPNKLV